MLDVIPESEINEAKDKLEKLIKDKALEAVKLKEKSIKTFEKNLNKAYNDRIKDIDAGFEANKKVIEERANHLRERVRKEEEIDANKIHAMSDMI